jgi:Na+/glutamate symporter
MGMIAVLLLLGKVIRNKVPRTRELNIPSAVWGGGIGLCFFWLATHYSSDDSVSQYSQRYRDGLDQFSRVLGLFVFSALLLGFGHPIKGTTANLLEVTGASGALITPADAATQNKACCRTAWAVVRAIWHEAVPQVLYHQLLVWVQIALGLVICLAVDPYIGKSSTNTGTPTNNSTGISKYLSVLVALGFEAGADITPFAPVELGEHKIP